MSKPLDLSRGFDRPLAKIKEAIRNAHALGPLYDDYVGKLGDAPLTITEAELREADAKKWKTAPGYMYAGVEGMSEQ